MKPRKLLKTENTGLLDMIASAIVPGKFRPGDITIIWVSAQHLTVIWPGAQRPLREKRVQALAKTWKQELFDPIRVSPIIRKDGKLQLRHIIDGNHRKHIMVTAFNNENVEVPCVVIDDCLDEKRAAELFKEFNSKDVRRAPNPVENFHVAVTAGDEPDVHINRIVQSLGLQIATSRASGNIRSPKGLQTAYLSHGGADTLSATLVIITNAWGRDPENFQTDIVNGIAMLLHKYKTQPVKRQHLVANLERKFTPSSLLAGAKAIQKISSGTMAKAIMEVVRRAYNNKLQAANKLLVGRDE